MKKYFITGIGTEIGKTLISAIFTEALNADYWKPIQAGGLDKTDSMRVKEFISNPTSVIHQEAHLLSEPMSPHAAAEIDGVQLKWENIKIPNVNKNIIIEGAGGLMVPINDSELMLHFAKLHDIEVVLVSQNYLGSINHTLMTYEILKANGCKLAGIVFNGPTNVETEKYILNYTGLNCLLRVFQEDNLDKEIIMKYANKIEWNNNGK